MDENIHSEWEMNSPVIARSFSDEAIPEVECQEEP